MTKFKDQEAWNGPSSKNWLVQFNRKVLFGLECLNLSMINIYCEVKEVAKLLNAGISSSVRDLKKWKHRAFSLLVSIFA